MTEPSLGQVAPEPTPPLTQLEFERLAQVHRQRAFRFALAFLNDIGLAEDAVQEALRRLYERRAEYPLKTHFVPYLIKTMARYCINQKRSLQAAPRQQKALAARLPSALRDDPAAALEQRESSRLLSDSVAQLPERERLCLLMTVCEGLSYKEVAEALSLTFSEVNGAIHRARTALRHRLGPQLQGTEAGSEGGAA